MLRGAWVGYAVSSFGVQAQPEILGLGGAILEEVYNFPRRYLTIGQQHLQIETHGAPCRRLLFYPLLDLDHFHDGTNPHDQRH